MKDESWLEASILEISKAHLFNVEGGSEPYWGIWNVIISVTFLIEYIFSASGLFSLSMRLMSRYLLSVLMHSACTHLHLCSVFTFRKSFPLATKTRTRGSTSASSPSTWRTTRRSYGSPSRAWTKTMTVRWSDISGKLTVYGFNSGSKIKPKSKKLNAGNWTWFLLRSSNLSWQWKRIYLRYSWQKYQDFCVFIFNRSDRFHGGKAVACRSGTGHQQRGGREDPQ